MSEEDEGFVIVASKDIDLTVFEEAVLPSVDGILMANSLHFIQEQHQFLRRLLSVTSCFVVVEYERNKPSPWGPYPVGFERLCQLFSEIGVQRVEKLATRRSRFGGTMYSAFVKQS